MGMLRYRSAICSTSQGHEEAVSRTGADASLRAFHWEGIHTSRTWVRQEETTISAKGSARSNTLAGSILIAFVAILVSLFLLWKTDRKKAAVGRRSVESMRDEVCDVTY